MSFPQDYNELNLLSHQLQLQKPKDVLQFCANYFNKKLEEQREGLRSAAKGAVPADTDTPPTFNLNNFNKPSGYFKNGARETVDPTTPSNFGQEKDDPTVNDAPLFRTPFDQDPKAIRRPPSPARSPFQNKTFSLAGTKRTAIEANTDPLAPNSNSNSNYRLQLPQITNLTNIDRTINRRVSVSAESMPTTTNDSWKPPYRQLDPEQITRLKNTVTTSFLFKNLDSTSLDLVIHAMEEKTSNPGDIIIKEGDEEGEYFYIIETGKVEFTINGNKVNSGESGSTFGELALMYNAPRAATVISVTQTILWALDRVTFRRILLEETSKRRAMFESFLKEVPLLKGLQHYELFKLADALDTRTINPGQIIIKEGDFGEEFFIIESGKVKVEKNENFISILKKGDYFGEIALLRNVPRQASVIAITELKVVVLLKSGFDRLLGTAVNVLKENDPLNISS